MKKIVPESATRENLQTLCILRLIPLAGMFYGVYYLLQTGNQNLQWDFIFAILAVLTLVIGFTWIRSFIPVPIHHPEFFGYLIVDISIYSLLMFNTGGATNPFISYLLVPITIAAIALPPSLTWLTGAISLGSYSLLLFWYIPLPAVAPGHNMSGFHHDTNINLHIIGMWLNFIVSALLIAYFVNKMAQTIAAQEKKLSRQNQRQLEDEQLLAVATVAASAAHEMGTPLNTMRLVSDEWIAAGANLTKNEISRDITVFRDQIDRCQQTLKKLSGTAREYSEKGKRAQKVEVYFKELIESWQVMRPDVKAVVTYSDGEKDAEILYHPSLSASIHNLLNNAGDASPQNVGIDVSWNARKACLEIRDYGGGIDEKVTGERLLDSGKPSGMGMGLFLSRFILARHHGTVELDSQAGGKGTLTKITLPLNAEDD